MAGQAVKWYKKYILVIHSGKCNGGSSVVYTHVWKRQSERRKRKLPTTAQDVAVDEYYKS